MQSNLARTDLGRRSVADMIQGYDVASQVAAREAELPYIGRKREAEINALEAATGVDVARANEINKLLDAKLASEVAAGNVRQAEADRIRTLTPLEKEKVLSERGLIDSQTKQNIDALKNRFPFSYGGVTGQVSPQQLLPYLGDVERREAEQLRHEDTQRRLREQSKILEEYREGNVARRDAETIVKRRKDSSEAEIAILSGFDRQGHKLGLQKGADYGPFIDTYNRNAGTPYAYLRGTDEERRKYKRRNYIKLRLPTLTDENGKSIQLTAEQVYRLSQRSQYKDMERYLRFLYKELGLDLNEYIEP